jgi:hypothetical protein
MVIEIKARQTQELKLDLTGFGDLDPEVLGLGDSRGYDVRIGIDQVQPKIVLEDRDPGKRRGSGERRGDLPVNVY